MTTAQVETLRGTLEKLEAELRAERNASAALRQQSERQIADLAVKLRDAEQPRAAAVADANAELQARFDSLRAEHSAVAAELAATQQRALQNLQAQLEQRSALYERRIAQLTEQADALLQREKKLRAAERAELEQRATEASSRHAGAERILREQLDAATARADGLDAHLAEQRAAVQRLERRVGELEAVVARQAEVGESQVTPPPRGALARIFYSPAARQYDSWMTHPLLQHSDGDHRND